MNVSPEMQAAARDALTIQNASNLCGVAQSFARHMKTVKREGDSESIRNHPVTRLFMSKLLDMTGGDKGMLAYEADTEACEALQEGKEPS